jgi:hypothetical protein
LINTTIPTIRSARPPKAPAATPIIIMTFGPVFGARMSAAFDCGGLGTDVVVAAARVDCREISSEVGVPFGWSVLVGTRG